MELRYRSLVYVEALNENDCTIHRAATPNRIRYWILWFYVKCTDGFHHSFAVPIIPNGIYTENGPGGRSWGLVKIVDGEWQISPSIHVGPDKAIDARLPNRGSLWHETPRIVNAKPYDEIWMKG